jgi:hypothetical protein
LFRFGLIGPARPLANYQHFLVRLGRDGLQIIGFLQIAQRLGVGSTRFGALRRFQRRYTEQVRRTRVVGIPLVRVFQRLALRREMKNHRKDDHSRIRRPESGQRTSHVQA